MPHDPTTHHITGGAPRRLDRGSFGRATRTPPLIGPITMTSHATDSPMTKPANPAEARRSTAPAPKITSNAAPTNSTNRRRPRTAVTTRPPGSRVRHSYPYPPSVDRLKSLTPRPPRGRWRDAVGGVRALWKPKLSDLDIGVWALTMAAVARTPIVRADPARAPRAGARRALLRVLRHPLQPWIQRLILHGWPHGWRTGRTRFTMPNL